MEELNKILEKTKEASKELENFCSEQKNQIILKIAKALVANKSKILMANKIDVEKGIAKGLTKAMINRLELTEEKIDSIASDMLKIIELQDPVGEIMEEYNRPNGLIIKKVRVPFGVICAIFESRPNVSVDITCLAIKTGNACVLRGGSEAINSNMAIIEVIKDAIRSDINPNIVTLITDTNRAIVLDLVKAKNYIDLVVPRGGKNLINFVCENSTVPYIETGAGNCHMYIDSEADFNIALKVCVNAKVSRPSVCNAIETILINKSIKDEFLKLLKEELDKYKVVIKGCSETQKIIDCEDLTEEDCYTEYNDYMVTIKIVDNLEQAIEHINKYGTKHSDCIVTKNIEKAEEFMNKVDSACVYVNASTRFSDGGEFGFGAELGISTQKLHARGPMGLREMTTYKYKIYGEGQIR